MSLLSKVPKDLIIEIVKRSRKQYYKLTCGTSTFYIRGKIKDAHDKIKNDWNIQKGIINNWLYYFDCFSRNSEKHKNLKERLIKSRTEGYKEEVKGEVFNCVLQVLEKYPIPSAKLEKISFRNEVVLHKMSKNDLIEYLCRIPLLKCYWFYLGSFSSEYHFYVENKIDVIEKIDTEIISSLIQEVQRLYRTEEEFRYIYNSFSKNVRMCEMKDIKLNRGEKIVQLNDVEIFIKKKYKTIARYHINYPRHVFGLKRIRYE